jgi:PTH1 family peptidyl-tRNA hydrolase
MVVDSIARQVGIDMRKLEKSAAVGRGELRGKKIILAKPVTFMNNSGESVAALARFYKVGAEPFCCCCRGF